MEIAVLYLKISRHQFSIWWSQISVYRLRYRVASKFILRTSNLQLMPCNFQIQSCYLLIYGRAHVFLFFFICVCLYIVVFSTYWVVFLFCLCTLLPVFLNSYLIYVICVCLHIVVSTTYRFVFPTLPVSLDCPFLIVPSEYPLTFTMYETLHCSIRLSNTNL